MDERDLAFRNHVYRRFVELGRAPRPDELASELGLADEEVEAALRRLHDAHALVLERDPPTRIRMLNPFSAVPTPYRVHAAGRWWYGNCAWDALGAVAALGGDGHLSASCADCGEPIELDVRGGRFAGADGYVFHCLVPASQWWDDIVFT